ncbi:MAG: septum formation protein Maf [Aquificae bacterium]|nr:septum formation protein Maf [Aquificota bacterium]
MELILASTSPRRREILSLLRVPFSVVAPEADEDEPLKDPVALARRLARKKALSVFKKHRNAAVVGADTVVYFKGRVLGKPKDEQEALEMLKALSGRWHTVVTGVAVYSPKGKVVFHDTARVKFRPFDEEEALYYVKTGEPLDKAGAYGVQGFGATLVEKIRGNFYTVMGLPVHRLYEELKKLGVVNLRGAERWSSPSAPRGS